MRILDGMPTEERQEAIRTLDFEMLRKLARHSKEIKTMVETRAPGMYYRALENGSYGRAMDIAVEFGLEDEMIKNARALQEKALREQTEVLYNLSVHALVWERAAELAKEAGWNDRMLAAAERANILLLINWPTAWSAAWQELVKRIQAGDIGEVRYTRYRSAHSGPIAIGCSPQFVRDLTTPSINGAGALMDYCCYGANLAATLLGRPDKVTGMRGHFGTEPAYAASEDNAIIVAQYQHAFGVCEASWSQPVGYAEANPVVYGSSGSLAVLHGRLLLQTPGSPVQEITPAPTEEPKRSAPEYMLHCLKTGSPIEGFCSPAVSRNAQEILQAGLDSTNTLATRTLPNT